MRASGSPAEVACQHAVSTNFFEAQEWQRTSTRVERTTKPSCMQPTETDSGSLVRRAGARAAVGHLDHHHSVGELPLCQERGVGLPISEGLPRMPGRRTPRGGAAGKSLVSGLDAARTDLGS